MTQETAGHAERNPRMLILEGPPGTGKTYRAARVAVALIDGEVPTDDLLIARYRQLVDAGLIVPVTFHPSYSYEDFVEGYRPRMTDGVMDYPVVKGPFLQAVNNTHVRPPLSTLFKPGMSLSAGGGSPYVVETVEEGGLVLSRTNTRQDAVNATNYYYAPFWTVARILDRGVTNVAIGGSQYDDRRELAKTLEMAPDQLAGISHISSVVRYVDSHVDQTVDETQHVVLVIDEINRADLSRVFGELITLIEIDKRDGAPEERSAILPYSSRVLTVPRTLHIIGTMNTADRSLSVFDYALRRRFTFEYVAPDPSLCPNDYGGANVSLWLETINQRISALLDRDACLGHAEFMRARLESRRLTLEKAAAAGSELRALAVAVTKYAVPTLLAVSGRDWAVVRAVLGGDLIEEDFGADFELDEFDASASSYRVNPSCDPTSESWNPDQFLKATRAVTGTDEGTDE